MANSQIGLLGTKLGMTQLFAEDGSVLPVTVIQAGPCRVLQTKTAESADGYNALQIGFGEQKDTRVSKALKNHTAKTGETVPMHIAEIRVDAETAAATAPGTELTAGEIFEAGTFVDVTGTSKGRGFSGVMKRHNFAGFERSHGVHEYFRHGGSIGTRLTPGHVLKGKKMPGQMGNKQVTVQNLALVKVDADRGLLYVKGGVPGPNGSVIKVRQAVKK